MTINNQQLVDYFMGYRRKVNPGKVKDFCLQDYLARINVDPSVANLSLELSELTKYDTAMCENLGAFYDNRGLDPHLLDVEQRIEEQWKVLEDWRDYYMSYKKTVDLMDPKLEETKTARKDLSMCKVVGKILRSSLEELAYNTDVSLALKEETYDSSLYTYLEMYIDKFTLSELAIIMDILEELKATKKISWYTYVECGVAVSYRLANATKESAGWWATCDQLRKHKQTHHKRDAKSPSYDDRFYGEISFSIEDAVDQMTAARQLAAINNWDVQTAYYNMMEELEEQSLGLPQENFQGTQDDWNDFISDHEFDSQFE